MENGQISVKREGQRDELYDSGPSHLPELEDPSSANATLMAPGRRSSRKRKKKVEMACVYCRRSHMICDDSRPCLRCVKRGIGHLCHDEPTPARQKKNNRKGDNAEDTASPSGSDAAEKTGGVGQPMNVFGNEVPIAQDPKQLSQSRNFPKPLPFNQEPFFYSEHAGSEFSSLNDFLSMIDDPELVNGALNDVSGNPDALLPFQMGSENNSSANFNSLLQFSPGVGAIANFPDTMTSTNKQMPIPQTTSQVFDGDPQQRRESVAKPAAGTNNDNASHQPVISDSARDKFFLTAADPTTEISPEERLKQVIKAKLEAGLLQPYNYAKGYARLQSYMDNYMNQSSRQRILKPLLIFRPAFRAIARSLKDVDLVLVEESFERMLLDYDRVFTSMAIPACLWRRTGEIYRGNKEFASLVGVTTDDLKDGKLAIYELMSEESAVNFWEKYGAIAFDKDQKAVLTSCNLRTKDGLKRKSCCFSFTIRRDRYNIPSCIVGNFIPIDP